jgi:protein-S-isoprenylcysteine O-methyltransferase Ste14
MILGVVLLAIGVALLLCGVFIPPPQRPQAALALKILGILLLSLGLAFTLVPWHHWSNSNWDDDCHTAPTTTVAPVR